MPGAKASGRLANSPMAAVAIAAATQVAVNAAP